MGAGLRTVIGSHSSAAPDWRYLKKLEREAIRRLRARGVVACTHQCGSGNGRTFLDAWPFDLEAHHDMRLRCVDGDVGVPEVIKE